MRRRSYWGGRKQCEQLGHEHTARTYLHGGLLLRNLLVHLAEKVLQLILAQLAADGTALDVGDENVLEHLGPFGLGYLDVGH